MLYQNMLEHIPTNSVDYSPLTLLVDNVNHACLLLIALCTFVVKAV
jgi:hypothetical protein